MAAILQLEDYTATTTVDLLSASGIQLISETATREFSYQDIGEQITRVYKLKATSTTKALARANVNALVELLRNGVRWHSDNSRSDSQAIYLKEAADGETATRMLVLNYAITSAPPIPGIDHLQTMDIEVYFNLALTLLNLKEETATTSPTIGTYVGSGAVGRKATLTGTANTALSRIIGSLTSSLVGTDITKVWAGICQYRGADFQHIWSFDYAVLGTEATETTTSGSYSTNVVLVTFTDALMKLRARMAVNPIYTAASALANMPHSKGTYYGLLRYKTTGAGTYMLRCGNRYYNNDQPAYSEPQLLDDSTNWRVVPIGVFSFPPRNRRLASDVTYEYENMEIAVDAQRLSGSGNLYLDTITWIPYDHFIYVDDLELRAGRTSPVRTEPDLDVLVYTNDSGSIRSLGTVVEKNNWMMPPIDGTYLQLVIAAERAASHVTTDDIAITLPIHEAFEAYNV